MTTFKEQIRYFFDNTDSNRYIAESALNCQLGDITRYFPTDIILEITQDDSDFTIIKITDKKTKEYHYVKFFTDDEDSIENSYIEVNWRFVTPTLTTIVEYD